MILDDNRFNRFLKWFYTGHEVVRGIMGIDHCSDGSTLSLSSDVIKHGLLANLSCMEVDGLKMQGPDNPTC